MAAGSTDGASLENAIANAVLEQVRSAASQGLIGELTLDTPLYEVGLDSLTTMDVVNRIEGTYQIRFSEDSLYDLETCRDLVELVRTKLGEDRAGQVATVAATKPQANDAVKSYKLSREHYDVTQFPECVAFNRRLSDSAAAGYANPFFRISHGVTEATSVIGGRDVISYTSFDYLGLSGAPQVVEAAKQAIDRFGTSASASRLVGGESSLLVDLDRELAGFLGTEAALVFPSGYGTNASLFGHLFNAEDLILYDELAHNSIVQGALLSQARRRAFPHNDHEFLDSLLHDVRNKYRRVVVAIEGVYSMDGDYPDLARFVEVKQRHGALLYVDEAHSVGVLGATGRGICEQFDIDPAAGDLWMGTISKALGSGGGYIAGRQPLIQYLKYTTPAFVFATASSPANVAAALAAVRAIPQEPERLEQLRARAQQFLDLARAEGLNTGNSHGTPIIPVILGDSLRCVAVSQLLLEQGIDARPILYPAVPESAARVRFFITANHTPQQIAHTVQVLAASIAATGGVRDEG